MGLGETVNNDVWISVSDLVYEPVYIKITKSVGNNTIDLIENVVWSSVFNSINDSVYIDIMDFYSDI